MAVVTVAFDELNTWLQNQPANTVDAPYELNITGLTADDLGDSTDTGTLGYILKGNSTKYVDLRPTTLPLRENMDSAFFECKTLVYCPSLPQGVKDLTYCFGSCENIKSDGFPVIPSSAEILLGIFNCCYSMVTAPAIPNGVKNIRNYCSNCTSLTSIPEIPQSVENMSNAFIGSNAVTSWHQKSAKFPNLEEAYNFLPRSATLTIYSDTPYEINSLLTTYPTSSSISLTLYGEYAEIPFADLNNELSALDANTASTPYKIKVTELTANDVQSSFNTGTLGYVLKQNNTKYVDLSKTELPNKASYYESFSYCTTLIVPPKLSNSVTSLMSCFMKCTSLTTPPLIPDSVVDFAFVFHGCTSLRTAPLLPESVQIISSAYLNCTSLTTIPNIPRSVIEMIDTFYGCSSLQEITLFEADIESLVTNNTAQNCFTGCTSLTKIGLPSEVAETDEWHCFRLKFDATTVEGKVYDKTKTAVTIPQTNVTKGTLKLPIKTDELWFPSSGYTDAEIDAIIEKVIQYRYSYFNDENVLDPSSKNFVLWADNPEKFKSNVAMGGGDNTPLGTVTSYEGTTDPTDGQWFLTDGRNTTGTSIELSTYYPSLYTFLGGSNVLPEIFDHSFPSAWETITLPITSATAITMQYDGQLWLIDNANRTSIYVNGVEEVWQTPANHTAQMFITFKKGDVIYANKTTVKTSVQYYKRYKIIKAVASTDTYTPPSSEIEQIESYFDNGINTIKNNALSYSTEEVATGGYWIDGKPIYIKTIDTGNLPNNTSKSIAHNILNLDRIIRLYGNAYRVSNKTFLSLPYPSTSSSGVIDVNVQNENIYIYTSTNRSEFIGYITLEYTKTTD